MFIHRLEIKVFVKPEDSDALVKQALLGLFPFDLSTEKTVVKEEIVSGLAEQTIKIMTVSLLKERHITKLLRALREKLGPEQVCVLLEQKESRLDEHLFFFIRLDKSALLEGKYILTDSGNCFHIRMNIAAFPAKRETALRVVEQIFSEQ